MKHENLRARISRHSTGLASANICSYPTFGSDLRIEFRIDENEKGKSVGCERERVQYQWRHVALRFLAPRNAASDENGQPIVWIDLSEICFFLISLHGCPSNEARFQPKCPSACVVLVCRIQVAATLCRNNSQQQAKAER